MTYGRSRLWTGISGVGFLVTAASLALLLDLPHLGLFPVHSQPLAMDLAWLGCLLLVYTMLHWPFDWIGGYLLPCRFGRLCHLLPAFVWACIRGTWVQMGIMIACAGVTLTAGRAGGREAALAAVFGLMVALVAGQGWLARAVGGLHLRTIPVPPVEAVLRSWNIRAPRWCVLAGIDPGFSGGITGLPGREEIVLPAQWFHNLDPETIAFEIARRTGAIATGSRLRGIALAMVWNLSGFWLASGMPGTGFATLADFLSLVFWFNLWSFLGLLLLPTLSRRGVLELDAFARERGIPASVFERAIAELDQLQDDEPRRPAAVESVFHPIPSVENRRLAWHSGGQPWGAWHGARMALFLSWPCLGLLGRAVHCNSGRPELWVMLPAD